MKKLKVPVYVITFFFLILPFIFVTDFFPFLRFGMFAEPIKSKVQMESFFVTYMDSASREKIFDPELYELQNESFQYLARNYFYRNQSDLLLEKLRTIKGEKRTGLRFFKVTNSISNPEKKDTVLITTR